MGAHWRQTSFVVDASTFTWAMAGYYEDDDVPGTDHDTRTIAALASWFVLSETRRGKNTLQR